MYPYKVSQKIKNLREFKNGTTKLRKIYTISEVNNNFIFILMSDGQTTLSKKNIEPHFEVGDRVKILSKTHGLSIESTNHEIGDIERIKTINDAGIYLSYMSAFEPTDLEWIPEEEEKEMKKYRQLKSICAVNIKEAQDDLECSEFKTEYIKFLENYGNMASVVYLDNFIEESSPARINFCIQHGFIEKIKNQKYKVEVELTEAEFTYLIHCVNMSIRQFCDIYNENAGDYRRIFNNDKPLTASDDRIYKLSDSVFKKIDKIFNEKIENKT